LNLDIAIFILSRYARITSPWSRWKQSI